MDFSSQQQTAITRVSQWLKSGRQPIFRLFGYAGTGKTTLAVHLAEHQKGQVIFGAFTGKAAKVMRSKGCWDASTIHSMIYEARADRNTGKVTFRKKSKQDFHKVALIVIDECSMVNEEMGEDLLSFGVPILALGDPAQLPPVKGAGFFTDFEPDYMLDEVHRQAEESPILRIATQIRNNEYDFRPMKEEGAQVVNKDDLDPRLAIDAGALIVGTHKTRSRYNAAMRDRLGFKGESPQKGETLICLKNDHTKGIFNGGIFEVYKVNRPTRAAEGTIFEMDIRDVDSDVTDVIDISVYEHFFQNRSAELDWKVLRGLQHFDFGYALTCHKSQGSQWDDVVVFDESRCFGDQANRWLYTAVTRAAEHLTLVL